jgi:hypothetical protein
MIKPQFVERLTRLKCSAFTLRIWTEAENTSELGGAPERFIALRQMVDSQRGSKNPKDILDACLLFLEDSDYVTAIEVLANLNQHGVVGYIKWP